MVPVPSELKAKVNSLSSVDDSTLFQLAALNLFGRARPVSGSVIVRARPKNGFEGFSSSLKSPRRIAAVGTVAVEVGVSRRRIHSSPQKKKSLLRSALKPPGSSTGPPR